MVAWEVAEDDARAEGAGGIKGAAGEVDAREFGDEEGEAWEELLVDGHRRRVVARKLYRCR